VPSVAVSPLIGGRTVKGPGAEMIDRFEGGTTPHQVTQCYKGLIDRLVVDEADGVDGDRFIVTRTLMGDAEGRRRVAEAVLEAAAVPR
jgi:LPPG:FO 2-phospho-L-lactate transferase